MGETKRGLDSAKVVLLVKEMLKLLHKRQIHKNWGTKKNPKFKDEGLENREIEGVKPAEMILKNTKIVGDRMLQRITHFKSKGSRHFHFPSLV